MKNRQRYLMLLLVVLMLLVVAVIPANARTVKTYFDGTEVYIGDIDPGRQWETPGGTFHVRDNTGQGEFLTSTDPRVLGDEYLSINGNFTFLPEPVFVTGQMWGTFEIVNDGGSWTGTFTGSRDENGYSFFKYVGHGSGGYQGMQIRIDYERLDPDPSTVATISGYILEQVP